MKKQLTTPILTIALLASLAGNVAQYAGSEPSSAKPETTDISNINVPVEEQQEDINTGIWNVTATFAITYQVTPKSAAFQDGYTVTTYQVDPEPRKVRSPEKPTEKDVTWAPDISQLPGVISVEVAAVKAAPRRAEK